MIEPQPFANLEEMIVIRLKGGGGTSFHAVFRYIKEHMQEKPPAGVIILTDG